MALYNWFRRRSCDSLEEAAENPGSVRRLSLMRPGVVLEEFAMLLPRLIAMRDIRLGWQSWNELPQELSELPKLRSVAILNTPIEGFPEFLASCPLLTCLALRGTEITSIPASVQAFRYLRRLDFSNNPTHEVPLELGHLPELRELQLADLGLKSLPESIAELRELRQLGLAGNRFSSTEASRIRSWFPRAVVYAWSTDEMAP